MTLIDEIMAARRTPHVYSEAIPQDFVLL